MLVGILAEAGWRKLLARRLEAGAELRVEDAIAGTKIILALPQARLRGLQTSDCWRWIA